MSINPRLAADGAKKVHHAHGLVADLLAAADDNQPEHDFVRRLAELLSNGLLDLRAAGVNVPPKRKDSR